jgi:hypothetical protein
MDEPPKQRWGCLQWGVLVFCMVLLALAVLPGGSRVSSQGNEMRAVSNCKQIILCLKLYAKDAESLYPDGKRPDLHTANQVFRELFKAEIVTDERIFGCPNSVFVPDNKIGSPPAFEKALMPGECHWMLLKHQSDDLHPRAPLVIENSLTAAWPPQWDVSPQAGNKRGRAWKGRRIIIGRNDGSVAVEKLRPDGTMDWHSPSNLDENGKSWIDTLTPEQVAKLAYWDVEEK